MAEIELQVLMYSEHEMGMIAENIGEKEKKKKKGIECLIVRKNNYLAVNQICLVVKWLKKRELTVVSQEKSSHRN